MWTVSSQSQCSRRSSTGTNESRRPEYSNEVESVLLTFSCYSGFITNNNQLNNADSPRDLPSSGSRFATSPQAQKSGALSVLQSFDPPQLLYLSFFCCNFFTSAIEKINWSLLMSKKASRRWQPQHHSFLRIYLSASPPHTSPDIYCGPGGRSGHRRAGGGTGTCSSRRWSSARAPAWRGSAARWWPPCRGPPRHFNGTIKTWWSGICPGYVSLIMVTT